MANPADTTKSRALRKCSFEICDRVVGKKGAKGLCSAHYKQSKVGVLRPVIVKSKPGQIPWCKIVDCPNKAEAFGLCPTHRQRQQRGASLDTPIQKRGEVQKFFDEVVLPYTGTDCLIWPFARSHGYAVGALKGGRNVSRLVCRLRHGEAPFAKADTCHSCGRGAHGCVSAQCIHWGTHSQNMLDKRKHGTSRSGLVHHWAKLSDDQVRAIVADPRPAKVIAQELRISANHVVTICQGRRRAAATGLTVSQSRRKRRV